MFPLPAEANVAQREMLQEGPLRSREFVLHIG